MHCEVQIPTKMDRCCDKEISRYALSSIQVTPAKEEGEVYLAATDSRKLVVIKSAGSADHQCLIPRSMAPKKNAEIDGWVKWRPGDDGKKTSSQWVRYDKSKRELIRGGGEYVEGRYPSIGDIFPAADDRYLAVRIDPVYLLDAFVAMGGEQAMTLLLKIPESPDLMPSYSHVENVLVDLWNGCADPLKRYWGLAVTSTGDLYVDHYNDVNHFDGETMRKYTYRFGVWPDGMLNNPQTIADCLYDKLMSEFKNTRMHVTDAIPLLAGGNFGVIMPLAEDSADGTQGNAVGTWNRKTQEFIEVWREARRDSEKAASEENGKCGNCKADDEPLNDDGLCSECEELRNDATRDHQAEEEAIADDMAEESGEYHKEPDACDLEPDEEDFEDEDEPEEIEEEETAPVESFAGQDEEADEFEFDLADIL